MESHKVKIDEKAGPEYTTAFFEGKYEADVNGAVDQYMEKYPPGQFATDIKFFQGSNPKRHVAVAKVTRLNQPIKINGAQNG